MIRFFFYRLLRILLDKNIALPYIMACQILTPFFSFLNIKECSDSVLQDSVFVLFNSHWFGLIMMMMMVMIIMMMTMTMVIMMVMMVMVMMMMMAGYG